MRIKRYNFFLAVITVFFQQSINAHENTKNSLLYQIGVLDTVFSEVLKEPREIYVQIPLSYNPEKNQKYPVVYILDGEVFLPSVCDVHDYFKNRIEGLKEKK